jgi:hypothetical protein
MVVLWMTEGCEDYESNVVYHINVFARFQPVYLLALLDFAMPCYGLALCPRRDPNLGKKEKERMGKWRWKGEVSNTYFH